MKAKTRLTNEERVLSAIALAGGMTRREIVELLDICAAEADSIVRNLHECGTIKPGPMRRGWTVYVLR